MTDAPPATRAWLLSWLLLALLALGLFWLHQATPTWGDDWHRTLPVDLGNLSDRLAWEYRSWTGRLSVLLVTYVLFWQYPGGWLLFNLLNTAVFLALVWGIARAATGGRSLQQPMLLAFIVIAIWFGTESFGEAVLWKTGAIAYLWTATAALWLIQPFVTLLAGGETPEETRARRWALPWAYLALAMSLENLSAAMLAFMALALLAAHRRGRRLPLSMTLAMLGQVLGSAILLLAPGNFARFRMQDDGQPIWVRLPLLLERIVEHLTVTVPLLPLLALLVVLLLRWPDFRALRLAWAWMIFAALTALAMLGSTGINFGTRTAFVSEVLFITAAAVLAAPLLARRGSTAVSIPLLVLATAVWSADALKLAEQTLVVTQQTERRAELMAAYRRAGIDRILLPSMAVPYLGGLKDDHDRGRFFLRDLHLDSPGNGWRNGTYAEDHGFAFANRLPRPALLFAPELDHDPRFEPLAMGLPGRYWRRQERRGLRSVEVLYALRDPPCSGVGVLRYERRGQTQEVPIPADSLAWVDAEGRWDRRVCAGQGVLPREAVGLRLRVEGSESPLPRP
jgi:hypothetical protein